MGKAKNVLVVVLPTTKLDNKNFEPLKGLGNNVQGLTRVKSGQNDRIRRFFNKIRSIFCYFQKNGPVKLLVPDPGGLLKRFSCISTGRTLFNKILAFKIENFGG